MNIKIKNIGVIKDANISIRGFTIIAGRNDTGKSTISKSLYAIFSCFSNMRIKVNELIKERLNQKINEISFYLFELKNLSSLENIKKKLYSQFISNECTKEKIEEILLSENILKETKNDKERLNSFINEIYDIISLPYETYVKTIRQRYFDIEFSSQISNVNDESYTELLLNIKDKENKLCFFNNKLTDVKEEIELIKSIVYYDSEQDINAFNKSSAWETYSSINYSHVQDLINKLKLEDNNIHIFNDELLSEFSKFFNDHKYNNIIVDDGAIVVSSNNNKKNIAIDNLSSGAKVILILKKLILSDYFKEKNLIIFDEPETHLHPEWQVALAEALVFLKKRFNLNILLSSHSPYFIAALDTFIRRYNLENETDYYFFERVNNNVEIKRVNDNMDLIYDTLDKPLNDIINLREQTINE